MIPWLSQGAALILVLPAPEPRQTNPKTPKPHDKCKKCLFKHNDIN